MIRLSICICAVADTVQDQFSRETDGETYVYSTNASLFRFPITVLLTKLGMMKVGLLLTLRMVINIISVGLKVWLYTVFRRNSVNYVQLSVILMVFICFDMVDHDWFTDLNHLGFAC